MLKKGFTLAESLIVLALLGALALITQPILMSHTNTANQKAHEIFDGTQGKFPELLKVMLRGGEFSGNANTVAFVDKLENYMKITKRCDGSATDGNGVALSQCFPSIITNADGSETVDVDDLSTTDTVTGASFTGEDLVALRLTNGMSMILAYNSACTINPTDTDADPRSCFAYAYDINSDESPNKEGGSYDMGGNISLIPQFPYCVSTLCYSTTIIDAGTYSADGTTTSTFAGAPSAECTGTNNNWTCPNYWNGAVNKCAEVGGELPSSSEYITILNDMYSNGFLDEYDTFLTGTATTTDYTIVAGGAGYGIMVTGSCGKYISRSFICKKP